MILKNALAIVALHSILVSTAGAQDRIRIRTGGKAPDTVRIDETSTPPMITVSAGVSVRGAPGSLVDLGGGQYEILSAGNAYYHVKTRSGVDSITVFDGPGASRYWLGSGADDDTVTVYDGPGSDQYKIEGKSGDDVFEVFDDAGDGNDTYYIKGASGEDLFEIVDGPGDDFYKLRGRSDDVLMFTDFPGDDDFMKLKGLSLD